MCLLVFLLSNGRALSFARTLIRKKGPGLSRLFCTPVRLSHSSSGQSTLETHIWVNSMFQEQLVTMHRSGVRPLFTALYLGFIYDGPWFQPILLQSVAGELVNKKNGLEREFRPLKP